jgi:hypothetical protein
MVTALTANAPGGSRTSTLAAIRLKRPGFSSWSCSGPRSSPRCRSQNQRMTRLKFTSKRERRCRQVPAAPSCAIAGSWRVPQPHRPVVPIVKAGNGRSARYPQRRPEGGMGRRPAALGQARTEPFCASGERDTHRLDPATAAASERPREYRFGARSPRSPPGNWAVCSGRPEAVNVPERPAGVGPGLRAPRRPALRLFGRPD